MTKTAYEYGVTFAVIIAVGFIAFCLGVAMGYQDGKQASSETYESIIKNNEQGQRVNQ